MTEQEKKLELIKELAEVIALLADDYNTDYVASRYLWDLWEKYNE